MNLYRSLLYTLALPLLLSGPTTAECKLTKAKQKDLSIDQQVELIYEQQQKARAKVEDALKPYLIPELASMVADYLYLSKKALKQAKKEKATRRMISQEKEIESNFRKFENRLSN